MGHSSDVHQLIMSDDGLEVAVMDSDATAGDSQKKKVGKSPSSPPASIKKR